MNRYDRYKDSGIPWLGKVPEHWNIVKLQYLISCASGDALPSYLICKDKNDDNSIPVIGGNGLFGYTTNSNFIENCLSIGRVGALCGNIHYINYPSWINDNALIVRLISDQILLEFLEYILISRNLNELASKTAQPLLTGTQVKYEKIVVPLIEEQTAITHYLDTKLGEIDALIDKQQTLLEKLAEQRTAVITHAVTKGLNPAAPIKKSGVEWLGDVPAHWETWKITHAIDLIGSGTTPKSDNAEYYDGDVLWVTTSELRENFISDTKQKVSNSAIKDYSALKIYPVNSVAMAMYGATIGRLGILEREATFNQACCVFGNSKILYYKFLFYWLWHRRPILISLSNGGGQPNLSQDDLKKLKLPIPSYEEQITITDYLDQETAKIDRLCDTVNQTIGRLKEYRTALITQAVTGKIKVTNE